MLGSRGNKMVTEWSQVSETLARYAEERGGKDDAKEIREPDT